MTHRADVHLITFHTEGPPSDSGKNLKVVSERFIGRASPHFSTAQSYCPRELTSISQDWDDYLADERASVLNQKDHDSDLRWNQDWAKIGFFRWKPRLIYEVLGSASVRDGDIVFYHDVDVERYPEYLKGLSKQGRFLRLKMAELDVLLFRDHPSLLVQTVKPELFEEFPPSPVMADQTLLSIWAGAIAIRKSPAGLAFARAWMNACSRQNVSPVSRRPLPEGFLISTGEQAVLAALYYSDEMQNSEIRIDTQYLERSRVIPPPARTKRLVRRKIRRIRKAIGI